jgi:predicted Zn-dependent protease
MLPRPLFILVLTAIFSLAGFCQQPATSFNSQTASIDVTVRSLPANQPVRDARVDVIDLRTGQFVGSGYTNVGGNVEISNIPNGDYDVVATSGVLEARQRTHVDDMSETVVLSMANSGNPDVGSASAVSVAQYKIPDKARDRLRKAQEQVGKQELDKAQKYIEEALKIYPKYAEALTLRAVIRMDLNQREAALEDLDSAIKIDPSYPMAYFAQGAIYNASKEFAKAIDFLQRGLALEPQSWQGYFELAKAYLGQSDYSRSLLYLQKAQAYSTAEYPPIHLVRAHALLSLKQYSEAMVELESYLKNASANDTDTVNARRTLDEVKAFVATQK